MSRFKQFLTFFILTLLSLFFTACGALTVSLSGEENINANEAYTYNATFTESLTTIADEYQWKVLSHYLDYRLTNDKDHDVVFRALDSGNYTLRVRLLLDDVYYSSEINISVEGPIIVGGHTVPPAPDPTQNSLSLSGIDLNKDGVRDDVERAIYFQDLRQVERELMMQEARLYQSILVDKEFGKRSSLSLFERSDKVMGCTFYLYLEHNMRFGRNSAYLEEISFNTDERRRLFSRYKATLYANKQNMKRENNTAISCEFNIERARKADR